VNKEKKRNLIYGNIEGVSCILFIGIKDLFNLDGFLLLLWWIIVGGWLGTSFGIKWKLMMERK